MVPMRAVAAAAAIALVASSAAGVSRAAQQPTFSAGVDLVHVGVTVTDRRGNPAPNLTAEHFEIREDGVRQTVTSFAPGGPGPLAPPLHVGLLLDVSQSMERDIGFMRTASIRFLNQLGDAASVTVVDFDTEVRMTRLAPGDFPRVVERIRNQAVQGRTALYDAIGVSLDSAQELTGRKIMLLYTDGGDTRSALSLRALLEMVKASDVTIYVVGALHGVPISARVSLRNVLERIAETSGGLAFFPQNARDLDEVYARVLSDVRAQYTLGYVSTNTRMDGAWRRIEIALTHPGARTLRIRARDGYFALYRP